MRIFIKFVLLFACSFSFALNIEVQLACKAAGKNLGAGNGSTVKYPNGSTMTNYAGKVGVTWYHQNGQVLTNYMGQPGATFRYSNGGTFSNYTGQQDVTWYYSNGTVMTNYGPALSPQEMADLACDLIQAGL